MSASGKSARKSKYRAVRTELDGVTFASKKEARRYAVLKLMERARAISNLRLQPRYELRVHGELVATYVGDFAYLQGGKEVVEDCKGFKTPVYRLKAKLLKACYGIEVLET